MVEKVSEYPAAAAWWAGSVKEYETFIKILGSPPGLKPGYTAAVCIEVERLSDVVQVPVQSIFEHGPKYYCVVYRDNRWQAQQVEIGPTNDKTVVIEKGLEPGTQIVLGSFAYRDKVDLPDIPTEIKENGAAKGRPDKPGKTTKTKGGPASKKQSKNKPKAKPSGGDMFAQFDKNKDGRVDKDELPAHLRPMMGQVDTDKNGSIGRGEWSSFQKKMRGAGGPNPGGPKKPGSGS